MNLPPDHGMISNSLSRLGLVADAVGLANHVHAAIEQGRPRLAHDARCLVAHAILAHEIEVWIGATVPDHRRSPMMTSDVYEVILAAVSEWFAR